MSAANTHDSRCPESLIQAIPAIRTRRGPRRRRPDNLHADKGYDYPHLRRLLHARGIRPRPFEVLDSSALARLLRERAQAFADACGGKPE